MLVEKNPLTMVKSLMKRRSGLRRELLLCSFFTLVVHNLFYRVYFIVFSVFTSNFYVIPTSDVFGIILNCRGVLS